VETVENRNYNILKWLIMLCIYLHRCKRQYNLQTWSNA
jgi:hypothetical protein